MSIEEIELLVQREARSFLDRGGELYDPQGNEYGRGLWNALEWLVRSHEESSAASADGLLDVTVTKLTSSQLDVVGIMVCLCGRSCCMTPFEASLRFTPEGVLASYVLRFGVCDRAGRFVEHPFSERRRVRERILADCPAGDRGWLLVVRRLRCPAAVPLKTNFKSSPGF